jgi:YlmC/YmxH family sporulation protein
VIALKYSDLAGKEIIDIDAGARLGVVSQSDLVIDIATGTVRSIIIPYKSGFFSRKEVEIPWYGIKKIGVDLIIVDLSTVQPLNIQLEKPENR